MKQVYRPRSLSMDECDVAHCKDCKKKCVKFWKFPK